MEAFRGVAARKVKIYFQLDELFRLLLLLQTSGFIGLATYLEQFGKSLEKHVILSQFVLGTLQEQLSSPGESISSPYEMMTE